MLVDVDSTMWPGSEFQASITRLEKKCRLSSNLALGFSSVSMCPLDRLSLMLKWVAGSTFTKPFRILKTSSRTDLSRRFSSDISLLLLLCCIAGAPRTEHYQLVRALSAGAVVAVL